jgi:hypothetical protein
MSRFQGPLDYTGDDLASVHGAESLAGGSLLWGDTVVASERAPGDEDVWSELTDSIDVRGGGGGGGGGKLGFQVIAALPEEGEGDEGAPGDAPGGGGGGDDEGADLLEGDEDDEKEGVPEQLPEHACAYCNVYNASTVVRCSATSKWFCNARSGAGGSHIVQHLVRGKHKEVSLHPDSPLGDAILECYNCGTRNVFLLGFIPAKTDSVVVLLCREPCLNLGALKDQGWDLTLWQPIVEDRCFLPWLVKQPSQREMDRARPVSGDQIAALEALWRTKPTATLEDLGKPDSEGAWWCRGPHLSSCLHVVRARVRRAPRCAPQLSSCRPRARTRVPPCPSRADPTCTPSPPSPPPARTPRAHAHVRACVQTPNSRRCPCCCATRTATSSRTCLRRW